MSHAPLVQVIIPVHDASRPLSRPLESLHRSGLALGTELGIIVVCHNVDASEIVERLPQHLISSVRFLEFSDGLPSPAGPRTYALSHSDSTYVSFLDSDDEFEDDALRQWISHAARLDLDVVIPRERHSTGPLVRNPVVRPWRKRDLDPIRDRLSYRTAPRGLIRREAIDRVDARFQTAVTNGSDQIFALKLWFGDTRKYYARNAPAYVLFADAATRVTTTSKPLATELAATHKLYLDEWFTSLDLDERRAIVTKFMRVQFYGGVEKRLRSNMWNEKASSDAREFIAASDRAAPGYQSSLSIADLALLRRLSEDADAAELAALARHRRRFGSPATLLTPRAGSLLKPDAPARFMLASLLL